MGSMEEYGRSPNDSASDHEALDEEVKKFLPLSEQYEGDVLTAMFPPSKAKLCELQPIGLWYMVPGRKYFGRVVYVVILWIWMKRGMNMLVADHDDKPGQIWSLIEYPCPGGESAMRKGTILAIKEPYFGPHMYSRRIFAIESPTDVVRLSKYDKIAKELFPQYCGPAFDDFSKAGEAAFAIGNFMDAIDIYSEGMRVANSATSNGTSSNRLHTLLLKRGFTYTCLRLHSKALLDFTEVLIAEPTNREALKQACRSCLELERYQAAQCYASGLKALSPEDIGVQKLQLRVFARLRQSLGEFDMKSLVASAKRNQKNMDVFTFVGDIELRQSKLGRRGVFAKQSLRAGQLFLCEKPIFIAYGINSSYGNEYKAEEKGIGTYWMSLLQQLASAAMADPFKARQLFELFEGHQSSLERKSRWKPSHGYDTARAYEILKHNYHTISRGMLSDEQADLGDYSSGSPLQESSPGIPSMWYRTSLFNHSCVPNATYTWIGEMMLVNTLRDVEEDEELTLTYCVNSISYDARREALKVFGFECSCELCEVDSGQLDRITARKEMLKCIGIAGNIDQLEEVLSCVTSTYYKQGAYNGLPWLELVTPLLFMAHNYLGPVSEWDQAPTKWKKKGSIAFSAIANIASGIKIARDPSSAYCGVVFTPASQPNGVCVVALVALAELLYVETYESDLEDMRLEGVMRKDVIALLQAAKSLYRLLYGENVTFNDHYGQYKCKAAFPYMGTIPAPANWEKIKAMVGAEPEVIPEFLRKMPKRSEEGKFEGSQS